MSKNECAMTRWGRESTVASHYPFTAALIELQRDFSDTELGDQLRADVPDLIQEATSLSGEDVSNSDAVRIIDGVYGCLYARYMGTCQTAETCTGRNLYAQLQEHSNV